MADKITFANRDDIITTYLAGVPEQELAKQLGVSRTPIRRLLLEAGVVIRGVSQANTLRMQRLTPQERLDLTANAHAAVRGKKPGTQARERQAQTCERLGVGIVPSENMLADQLRQAGFGLRQQRAIGKYNVDIAIDTPPIAVEVFGGNWHSCGRHAARFFERTKYLLGAGWHVVIVWVDGRRHPLDIRARDYIVTLADELRRDPPASSQYRVILGNGQPAPAIATYFNDLAAIERLRGST